MKYWFIFYKSNLILEKLPDDSYTIPFQELPPVACASKENIRVISPLRGKEVRSFYIDEPLDDNDRFVMCNLRESYYKLEHDLYLKAGKCEEIIYWDSNNRFCGKCGGKMYMNTDISKVCQCCGNEVWPLLSTAVIVLIQRSDEALLVKANNFRKDFYGLVAGFVETGETLEEAVEREVAEETGLKIKNLKYYASQPWPYPCGLMCGFYAEYESGDIHLQLSELKTGGWFRYDNLPNIPEKLSIARMLIDNWVAQKMK